MQRDTSNFHEMETIYFTWLNTYLHVKKPLSAPVTGLLGEALCCRRQALCQRGSAACFALGGGQ